MVLYMMQAGSAEEPAACMAAAAIRFWPHIAGLLHDGDDFDRRCQIEDIKRGTMSTILKIRKKGRTDDQYVIHSYDGANDEMADLVQAAMEFYDATGLASRQFIDKMAAAGETPS